MYYTIYKTTNIINGKFYIGMHQTKNLDDGYMGSGKLLKRAINKYGIDNFVKEIMFVFDEEWKMKLAEKILVIVDTEITYNMCSGGYGSWTHINQENRELQLKAAIKGNASRKVLYNNDLEWQKQYRKSLSDGVKKYYSNNRSHWKGRKHTQDSIQKMKKAKAGKHSGKDNPQYGTIWITDGKTNQKIKKNEEIPYGWRRGRKTPPKR